MFWECWSIASYFQHHFSEHKNYIGAVLIKLFIIRERNLFSVYHVC
jgi:hypothetical protein